MALVEFISMYPFHLSAIVMVWFAFVRHPVTFLSLGFTIAALIRKRSDAASYSHLFVLAIVTETVSALTFVFVMLNWVTDVTIDNRLNMVVYMAPAVVLWCDHIQSARARVQFDTAVDLPLIGTFVIIASTIASSVLPFYMQPVWVFGSVLCAVLLLIHWIVYTIVRVTHTCIVEWRRRRIWILLEDDGLTSHVPSIHVRNEMS